MNWFSRIFALPKSHNSLSDLLGDTLARQLEKDLDRTEGLVKESFRFIIENPSRSDSFLRAWLELVRENARLLRLDMTTTDPFRRVRSRTHAFAERWGLKW